MKPWLANSSDARRARYLGSEFRRVSRHSRRRRFLNPAEAGNLVSGLSRQATILETMPTVGVSPDPGDNPVLAMAGDLAPEGLVFIPASKSPNGKPLVDSTSRCL